MAAKKCEPLNSLNTEGEGGACLEFHGIAVATDQEVGTYINIHTSIYIHKNA